MSGIPADSRPNTGLANSLSNIFKLADVNGLKWVRYVGPNSASLEAPKDDPVLNSYAKLLNEGYACSWRRLSPSTDGITGESKDLWVFYFTELPDISDKLAEGLQEEATGTWDEGMTPESNTMLYRSLHNIIERSLMSETFLPLGKWFAKADSSVATDGSSRGCFLCSFSFFVHAHRYICASVDMRAGPHLQPLLPSHINQALASSTGLQVILSPSGLNAVMTGHTYKLSDSGIREVLDEWKLFYPRRFAADPSPNLPAAIEVMLGGVRMRYPSQFVFLYHGCEEPRPSPPPSSLDQCSLLDSIQESWDSAGCIDAVQQQKEIAQCKCQEHTPSRSHNRRSSAHLDLPLRGGNRGSNRYEPYPSGRPMRELATPGTLHLANTPILNIKRRLSKPGLPMYANPDLSSPAVPHPLSPSLHSSKASSLGSIARSTPLPTISLSTAGSLSNNAKFTTSGKLYDKARVSLLTSSQGSTRSEQDQLVERRSSREGAWWDSLNLPESADSLLSLQLPQEPRPTVGSPNQPLMLSHGKNSSSQELAHSPFLAGIGLKTEGHNLTMNGLPDELHTGRADPLLGGMMNGGGLQSEFKPKGPIDLISEKAVVIDSSVPQDFLFDEEDDSQEGPQLLFGDVRGPGEREERMDTSQHNKGIKLLSAVDTVELSRIYPTPPSVELPESDSKYEEIKIEERMEGPVAIWDSSAGLCDDLYVPPEFEPLPLSDLPSLREKLPERFVYAPSSAKRDSASSQPQGSGCETSSSKTGGSSQSEPQKFIFPPVSTKGSNRDALTLPLTQKRPHMYTPHTLTSSPAYPHPKAPSRFPLHITTPSLTPLASPYDPSITPTPLSANTNRLMPVLPEAHALYVNISLLDSALGTNFSETMQFSAGPLMSTLHSFLMSKRMKLDSVADVSGVDNTMGSTTDLMSYQEEKPIMTFGIADYPSLGFREELGMGGGGEMGEWDSPLGVMSKLLPETVKRETSASSGTADAPDLDIVHSRKVIKFVELFQDYCLTLCTNGLHDDQTISTGHTLSRGQNQLLLQFLEKSDELQEKLSSRLYHSHSVVSAIRNANQLIVNASKKLGGGAGQLPNKPTVSKEDNSGAWILDLLTLPTKFMTKRLKDLRAVFQNSFHQAPCLKFTTKGPMTLKDLQQLAPSQTAIGDDCVSLPLPPVLVGYDHEWLSVSPLALPAWDKLLFEPYSMKKSLLYMVVVPPSISSHDILPVLRKYFKELSITFKNCNLGQHTPLEAGVAENGILLISPHTDTGGGSNTTDPNTNTRHSAATVQLRRFCKKVLVSFLSTLPTNDDELLTSHTSSTPSQDYPTSTHPPPPPTPVSIVLYVLCNNPLVTDTATDKRINPKLTKSGNSKMMQESFQMLQIFSELLSDKEVPEFIQRKLVLQLLNPKDLLGPFSCQAGQLRSLAFSVYSRCSSDLTHERRQSLTSFGPTAERQKIAHMFNTHLITSPPFILSPEAPLSALGPIVGTQTHHILFDPEEPVLFCGYCVSPDRRWLLVVCCDRQGELLNSAVLGIPSCQNIDQSCVLALKQLWDYVVSIIAGTVYKWSVVITRFGKPSTSEVSHWPEIIPNDGLIIVNQAMRGDCDTCKISTSIPKISNVIVISVQPERNIQLFPNNDPNPSVTHIMVLPHDPRGAGSNLTPGPAGNEVDDFFDLTFTAAGESGGGQDMDTGLDMTAGIDFGAELSGINLMDELSNNQMAYPVEDSGPKATGYLISTAPAGNLPNEFWGHEKPQNFCSIFKVLLHCHRIPLERTADSPQETLGSILLCFDALSWLTMDQVTRQRKSCLPLHLFVLSKLYQLFTLLDQPR